MVVAAAGNSAADWCTFDYDPMYDPDTTPDKLLVGATLSLVWQLTSWGILHYLSNYGACVHVQVPPP